MKVKFQKRNIIALIAVSLLATQSYAKRGNKPPPAPVVPPTPVGEVVNFSAPVASIGHDGNISMHDVDNDGNADMVFFHLPVGQSYMALAIHKNVSGSFSSVADSILPMGDANSYDGMQYAFGDINGDGYEDIVYIGRHHKLTYNGGPSTAPIATDPTLFTALNLGDGTFGLVQEYSAFAASTIANMDYLRVDAVNIADMNNDGINDIVLTFEATNFNTANRSERLSILLNTTVSGDMNVSLLTTTNVIDTTRSVLSASSIADMNNDGTMDIVSTHPGDRFVTVWFNDGDGINGAITTISIRDRHNTGYTPHLVDVDADGAKDIVLVYGNFYKVLKNKGGRKIGQFKVKPVNRVPGTDVGSSGNSLFSDQIADINKDGFPDLVVLVRSHNPYAGNGVISVLYGDGSNTFGQTMSSQITDFGVNNSSGSGQGLVLGDLDNDGDSDIIQYGRYPFSAYTTTVLLHNSLNP